MPIIIENTELDETNAEFNYAAGFVNHTDKLVYLTGKAGTGKTTFLKYLSKTTTKNTVILAPTGVAAINAGGQTIHSFFQIRPSIYVPNDKRLRIRPDVGDEDKSTIYDHFKLHKEKLEIIRGLELLIIDEISMVRCDLIDVLDRLLRVYRHKENQPFGGVQVILIGDTFQLPPIADFDQWDILKNYYESPYFFSSNVIKPLLKKELKYIELKKICRQNEQEFIDLLNRVRINQVTQNELSILNSKYNPRFSPDKNSNYITLATHNKIVESTNLIKLSELTTELRLYEATVTNIFPDNIMPTERVLQLKEGAQVMFIKNDKGKGFYNGKIAKITKLEESKIITEFSDGTEILVEKETWKNIKYSWNEKEGKIMEEVIGTFTQFPIKLAWAITVHKSQGLTFEKVVADLGAAFSPGQVYVALSRCTSFNGLVLKTRIERDVIKTDPKVLLFAQNETPSTLIVEELNSGKADYYYKKSRESIKELNFPEAYKYFILATKFRNDIETDLFKKYFSSFLSRVHKSKEFYKSRYFDYFAEVERLNRHIYETDSNWSEYVQELNSELDKGKSKITEQNNAIKLLLDKTTEFEKSLLKLQSNLETCQREKRDLNIKLDSTEKLLRHHKNKSEQQELLIHAHEKEILRLKNLKWYNKLFGQE